MSTPIRSVDPQIGGQIVESTLGGNIGKKLNSTAHAFVLPENQFENIGRPNYEAQDRELFVPLEKTTAHRGADAPGDVER